MVNIVAVVFAHNEETPIKLTLNILNKFKSAKKITHIVVVNDGSTDNTVKIAREAGAIVVSHQKNRGKREAFITGAIEAKKLGAEVMLNLDADITRFPKRTLKRMVKEVTIKGKLMSIAQQYEVRLIDSPNHARKVQNSYSNAQRAINMKALDPLFNGNPKWWKMLRIKKSNPPQTREYLNFNKETQIKGTKWGLEFALDNLIPKKKCVTLKDPIITRESFRLNSLNATNYAQIHGRQIIENYLLKRIKKAQALKQEYQQAEIRRKIRRKLLTKKSERKAANLRRIQKRNHI
jgi:glycosyltransferase involved in cell wall biosynthesis